MSTFFNFFQTQRARPPDEPSMIWFPFPGQTKITSNPGRFSQPESNRIALRKPKNGSDLAPRSSGKENHRKM
jgi:hypothetical protein